MGRRHLKLEMAMAHTSATVLNDFVRRIISVAFFVSMEGSSFDAYFACIYKCDSRKYLTGWKRWKKLWPGSGRDEMGIAFCFRIFTSFVGLLKFLLIYNGLRVQSSRIEGAATGIK